MQPLTRIVLSFDHHHRSPEEMAVTTALSTLDPKENIIFFGESRNIQMKALGQYSIELLSEDKKNSTASSMHLLINCMLSDLDFSYLGDLLAEIYADSYLKSLFEKEQFKTYAPQAKGFCESGSNQAFSLKSLTDGQNNVVQIVKLLFKILDEKLSKQPPQLKEQFLDINIKACMKMLAPLDWRIMTRIAEALAVSKIEQVPKQQIQKDQFNTEDELCIDDVKKLLYSPQEVSVPHLEYLNNKVRTKFQVEKITLVVTEHLSKPQPKPVTFLVRVGIAHKDELIAGLQKRFGQECLHEVDLLGISSRKMLQLIKG